MKDFERIQVVGVGHLAVEFHGQTVASRRPNLFFLSLGMVCANNRANSACSITDRTDRAIAAKYASKGISASRLE